jgi:hypothetical protein
MRQILLLICIFSITVTARAQFGASKYKSGYYYSSSGQKLSGLISFNPAFDRLYYKENEEAKYQKIKINDISALIITDKEIPDSLSVMTEDGKGNKKYFAKLVINSPATKIYYKFVSINTGGAGPTMTTGVAPNSSGVGVHNTYTWSTRAGYSGTISIPMYEENGTTYEITRSNFKEILTKVLVNKPDLIQQINDKTLKLKDMNKIISIYNGDDTIKTK